MVSKNKKAVTDETQAAAEATPTTEAPATNGNGDKRKKTVCPVTREEFEGAAGPIQLIIGGRAYTAQARVFGSGSFGWYFGEKVKVIVDVPGKGEVELTCQTGMNMVVVNSKGPAAE